MKYTKIILIVLMVLLIGIIVTLIIINNNQKNQPKIELKNGKSEEDVILDKVTFSEITSTYDGGITTLSAKMLNNTEETKNFKIEIILKDNDGKKIKSVMQVVENLQPKRPKVLMMGIVGDYSYVTKIEFEIVE